MCTSPDWLLKMAGDCARPHSICFAPTLDRVTIAPGTAFFSESEVFVKFCGKTAGKERDDGRLTKRSGLS
jgi:hypothetical protein